MELFEDNLGDKNVLPKEKLDKFAPLAYRMRPPSLDEFVGQEHIVGPDTILRRAIEEDTLTSLIFWGPPGSGKTTLALIIANLTKSNFLRFSAVTSGIAEIRKVMKEAKEKWSLYNQKTILFIDEIHRFNKLQQDAFLPFLEDGIIILVGATVENPYFEVNKALLSRSKIYQLHLLSYKEIEQIIKRALSDKERGLGRYKVRLEEKAKKHIINLANGDARVALNALEIATLATKPDRKGERYISLRVAEEAVQKRSLTYDKDGDSHYDIISAFIKSMRGSDPDAALYWLARMIYAGEDPKFIARRMVIQAAEDVGNADPLALVVATAAFQAVEYVGMPEAQIPLAQAAIYISCAPKSNAVYLGINKALSEVKNLEAESVPIHLRDASYWGAKLLGHQKDYKYPHNFLGNFIEQQYLPDNVKENTYYKPTDNGYEAKIKQRLKKWGKVSRSQEVKESRGQGVKEV